MAELHNTNNLRVLMTADTVGGVWSYAIELCKTMQEFGIHYYIVTTGAPLQPSQWEETRLLDNVDIYETSFKLEWMDSPWSSIDAAGSWLLALEAKLQPDLVHLNCFSYGALAWKAPVLMVAHSDVFSWWKAVHRSMPPASWNEYYQRLKSGLDGADQLVAPSGYMLNEITSIYHTTTSGKVIYNGRSSGTFYPAAKQPVVFSMGRVWDEAKNIQLLVNAAAAISAPVRIAGNNNFAGNQTSVHGTNINHLGKLDTAGVASELSTAMVYVLPALYEPFGLSILEAALSGCALVLGDIPSLRELWDDCAVYVDPSDSLQFSDSVNNLLTNEEARNALVTKSLQRAKLYNTPTMSNNYFSTYNELLTLKSQLLHKELA